MSGAGDVALRGKIEAAYSRWTRRAPFLFIRGAWDVSPQGDRLNAIFRDAYPFADGPEAWAWDPEVWRVEPWDPN